MKIESLYLNRLLKTSAGELLSLTNFFGIFFSGKLDFGAQVFSLLLPLLLFGLKFGWRQLSATVHHLFVHFVEDIADWISRWCLRSAPLWSHFYGGVRWRCLCSYNSIICQICGSCDKGVFYVIVASGCFTPLRLFTLAWSAILGEIDNDNFGCGLFFRMRGTITSSEWAARRLGEWAACRLIRGCGHHGLVAISRLKHAEVLFLWIDIGSTRLLEGGSLRWGLCCQCGLL